MPDHSQNLTETFIRRVIVDECVGRSSKLVEEFSRSFSTGQTLEFVFLSEAHRAIPDPEILRKLLNAETVLLTHDRLLHHQARDLGFRSYTLNEAGQLTPHGVANLPGPKPLPPALGGALRSDYTHPPNTIASALKGGLQEPDFKRYRTRRRRIRSYFGPQGPSLVSVTIGNKPTPKGLLCGYFMALAGDWGVKGIQASEGYALNCGGPSNTAWGIIHALRDLYLHQLETVRTELYIIPPDSLLLCQGVISGTSAPKSPPDEALTRLLGGLTAVTAHPCEKGRFFDRMERKLISLGRGASNEIVPVNFGALIESFLTARG